MPKASTFPLYDRITGGKLTQLLTDWRAEGVSFDVMAERLRDMGIAASRSTVNRWCAEQGIAQ